MILSARQVLQLVPAILLFPPCLAVGQPKADPNAFFESAKQSMQLRELPWHPARAGVAMKSLTGVQDVQDLRAVLAKGDASVLLADSKAKPSIAGLQLHRVLGDTSIATIQLVNFDPGSLADTERADAPKRLCDGPEPYCGAIRTEGWTKGVSGETLVMRVGGEGKPRGQAVLVRDGATVSGALNIGAKIYSMRQLDRWLFAITAPKKEELERSKEDVLDLKPNGAGVVKPAPPGADTGDTCPNPKATQVLEVAVMATRTATSQAMAAGHGMRQLIRTAEAISNLSFKNSDINGEVRVTHISETSFTESGDFVADMKEVLKPGGRARDVREVRHKSRADVAVVVVDHPSATNCGIASDINVAKGKAYAIVNWKCLTDKFSFIHEIGHLAGAWHDPKTLGPGFTVTPPNAHGYVTTGAAPVATIMAYREACGAPCGRVWHWSNPFTKTEDGQVLGSVEVSFDACVWRKRLPAIVSFDGG